MIDGQEAIPVVFEYGANAYCKYCHTWGSTEDIKGICGNCGQTGFMIANPFPDNMVPYVILPKPVEGNTLQ